MATTILESLVYSVQVNSGNSVQVMGTLQGRMEKMVRLATELNSQLLNLGKGHKLNDVSDSMKTLGDNTKTTHDNLKGLQATVGKMKGNIKIKVGMGINGGLGRTQSTQAQKPIIQPTGKGTPEDKLSKGLTTSLATFMAIKATIGGIANSFSSLSQKADKAFDDMANMESRIDTFFRASEGVRKEVGATTDMYAGNVEKYKDIMATSIKMIQDENKKFLTTNTLKNIASAVSSVGVSLDTATSKEFMRSIQDFSIAKYGAKAELTLNEQLNLASIFTRALAGRAGTLRSSGIVISDEQVKFLNTSQDIDKKVELLLKVLKSNTDGLADEMIKNNPMMAKIQERQERRLEEIAGYSKAIKNSTSNFRDTLIVPMQGLVLRTISNLIGGFKGFDLNERQEAQATLATGTIGGALMGGALGLKFGGAQGALVGGIIGALVTPTMAFIEQVKVDLERKLNGQATFFSDITLSLVTGVIDYTKGMFKFYTSWFKMFYSIFEFIYEVMSPIIEPLKNVVVRVVEAIGGITGIFDTMSSKIDSITKGIKGAKDWWGDTISTPIKGISDIRDKVSKNGEQYYIDNRKIEIQAVDGQLTQNAQALLDTVSLSKTLEDMANMNLGDLK